MWYDARALMDLDPTTLVDEDLEKGRDVLLGSMRATERDLSDKERKNPDGTVMTSVQYRNWRRKAIKSNDYRTEKYRQFKREIQRRRAEKYAAAKETRN